MVGIKNEILGIRIVMNKIDYQKVVEAFGGAFDVECRKVSGACGEFYVIFIDHSTDKDVLSESIIKPLVESKSPIESEADFLACVTAPASFDLMTSQETTAQDVAKGKVALIKADGSLALTVVLRKVFMRAVSEPPTSSVLKGPREGFTEELQVNASLIRRRIRSTALRLEKLSVGKYSETDVCLVYLDGVTSMELVDSVKKKLGTMDVDGVVDSSYIAKFLQKRRYSIFRQEGTTEKPDILAAKLLEGRMGILVDGSPIALTLPYIFIEDLQDSSDYTKSEPRANILRFIRMTAIVTAVILPALYVAVQEFQYQMLPLKFLITILNSVTGIPLTPTLEMLVVLLLFEMLNETSVRMPKYVGMALSVVGAIVLGDTAVKAGILSSPAVLITALSGIALYCVPDDAGTFSTLRIVFVVLAGVLGIYGIALGTVATIVYVAEFNSYGAPYLAPYAPFIAKDMADSMTKSSFVDNDTRPYSFPNKNRVRNRL